MSSTVQLPSGGRWASRAEFETWWLANVAAFNRLAVTDPEEWERVAKHVDEFQGANPQ